MPLVQIQGRITRTNDASAAFVEQAAIVPFSIVMRIRLCYPYRMNKNAQKQYSAMLAKAIAVFCVRNTFLEDLHAGASVISKTGDYSDVKVVTPDREIPWNDISRISQEEMKKLMKQVVNKLYTVLMSLEDEEAMHLVFSRGQDYTRHWDDPEFLPNFLKPFVPPDDESALMPQETNEGRNS